MNAHESRHPNWIPVRPGDGAIKKGDRYRVEYHPDATESVTSRNWNARDFHPDTAYFVWRPEPEPEPEPWEMIPEGRENAAVVAVGVEDRAPVVGTYYRDDEFLYTITASDRLFLLAALSRITSAVPVKPVPAEALEALRAAREGRLDYPIISTDAAADRLLAAVDGADQ